MTNPVPSPVPSFVTHEVTNQAPPMGAYDAWQTDTALREAISRERGQAKPLADYGCSIGTAGMREAGREANRHLPELLLFDRGGRRLDEMRFHPAYHRLMTESLGAGYAAIAWEGTPGGHVTHAAMVYLASQIEPGHCCPMTMTYAAIPALAAAGTVAAEWRAKLMSRSYDPSTRPVGDKPGATLGMAMTEKQGGSDVRANTTRAEADGHRRLAGAVLRLLHRQLAAFHPRLEAGPELGREVIHEQDRHNVSRGLQHVRLRQTERHQQHFLLSATDVVARRLPCHADP